MQQSVIQVTMAQMAVMEKMVLMVQSENVEKMNFHRASHLFFLVAVPPVAAAAAAVAAVVGPEANQVVAVAAVVAAVGLSTSLGSMPVKKLRAKLAVTGIGLEMVVMEEMAALADLVGVATMGRMVV